MKKQAKLKLIKSGATEGYKISDIMDLMKFDQKGNSLILGIFIVALVMTGIFGAYFLGSRVSNKLPQSVTDYSQPSTTAASSSTPDASPSIPSSWSLKRSEVCGVSVQLPSNEKSLLMSGEDDKSDSRDQGALWQFKENNQYSSDFFNSSIEVIYINPKAFGSGYVAGAVWVTCAPNNSGYTTDSFLVTYEKKFVERVGGDSSYEGYGINSKNQLTKWGLPVWELTYKGGMSSNGDPTFYFATKDHIYSAKMVAGSNDSFVRETTQKIFDNLQF